MTPGKLEVLIKFSELPSPTTNGASYSFTLYCDGRRVTVTVRPKVWNKLVKAASEYPQWVASLTGKLGPGKGNDFTLLEPALQVFEKKPKAEPPPPDPVPDPAPTSLGLRPTLTLKRASA